MFSPAIRHGFMLGATLIALGMLPVIARSSTATTSDRITVEWTNPDDFAEMRQNPGPWIGRPSASEWLPELAKSLRERADGVLAPGQHLDVTFTDIKRAGAFEPWRGPRWDDIRIVKDIYPPRIDLRFKLTDATGATLREGNAILRDPAFMSRDLPNASDPLRYEKRMLAAWVQREFTTPPK